VVLVSPTRRWVTSSPSGTRVSLIPSLSRLPVTSSTTTMRTVRLFSRRSWILLARRVPASGPPSTLSTSACPSPLSASLSSPAASLPSSRSVAVPPSSSRAPPPASLVTSRSSSTTLSRPFTPPRSSRTPRASCSCRT
jgi:hypothetical protein